MVVKIDRIKRRTYQGPEEVLPEAISPQQLTTPTTSLPFPKDTIATFKRDTENGCFSLPPPPPPTQIPSPNFSSAINKLKADAINKKNGSEEHVNDSTFLSILRAACAQKNLQEKSLRLNFQKNELISHQQILANKKMDEIYNSIQDEETKKEWLGYVQTALTVAATSIFVVGVGSALITSAATLAPFSAAFGLAASSFAKASALTFGAQGVAGIGQAYLTHQTTEHKAQSAKVSKELDFDLKKLQKIQEEMKQTVEKNKDLCAMVSTLIKREAETKKY